MPSFVDKFGRPLRPLWEKPDVLWGIIRRPREVGFDDDLIGRERQAPRRLVAVSTRQPVISEAKQTIGSRSNEVCVRRLSDRFVDSAGARSDEVGVLQAQAK